MANLIQKSLICLLAVGVVLSQNAPQRGGGGGGFNCPTERGVFEHGQDCTKFYQCDGGVATAMDCPAQLIFNPQVSFCDWPHRAPNPSCADRAPSPLTPQTAQICRNNPGNPTEAFNAGHPDLCNAFYSCSTSFLFAPCTFCGEGMYYNMEARGCRDYQAAGLDLAVVCQGRQFVQHADKVFRQLDGSCWPFASPNPMQALIDAIRGGGGRQPTTGPRTG